MPAAFRLPSRAVLGVFALALAVRLVHLFEAHLSPYAAGLLLDAEEYQALARALLTGHWHEAAAATYVHGVLYPVLWAGVEWLGGGPLSLQLLQALLGACACVFLQHAARRWLSPGAALACGLAAALYAPFVVFGGQLLATTLVVFLVTALLAVLARDDAAATRPAVGAGLLLALLAATRANTLLLAPVALAWIWHRAGVEQRAPRRAVLALAAGLVVGLTPVVAQNLATEATPVPFEGAWSFYMGHNPDADGTPYARQGLDWQRLESLGFHDGWRATPAQRGRTYLAAGLGFVAAHPGQEAYLLWRKLRLFWNACQVPVSVDLGWYTRHTVTGRWLPGFGLLAPLALLGLGLNLRRWRAWGLPVGGVAAFLVSGLLFTVCARYRLPAVPFLLLFTADAAWRLVGAARTVIAPRATADAVHPGDPGLAPKWRPLALWGLGLVVAGVWIHTGVDPAAVDHLRPLWLQGTLRMRLGDPVGAEALFAAAAKAHPRDADVRNSLGAARERLGRTAEAAADYRAALALAPDHSRAWLNLGGLYLREHREHDAQAAVRQALAADPRPLIQAEGRLDLGQIFLESRQPKVAYDVLHEALAIRDGGTLRYALAAVCHALNRNDEELEHVQRAVELSPELAPAWASLGSLRLNRGDLPGAEAALQHAAQLDPDSPVPLRRLAVVYQRLGKTAEANQALEQARRILQQRARRPGIGAP